MKSNLALKERTYSFDELSPDAKETARESWRTSDDGSNLQGVIEDAAECAKILGIDLIADTTTRCSEPTIYWSGFCSQGDGACFEGRYTFRPEAIAEIRQHAGQDTILHDIADELHRLSNPSRLTFCGGAITLVDHEWQEEPQSSALYAKMTHSGHYYHSGCMDVEVSYSEGMEDPPIETANAVTEQMRAFADWIYKHLEAENEYQNSDEAVDDMLSEYTFDEDGEIV